MACHGVFCKLYHSLMIFHCLTPRAFRRVGFIQWKNIRLWYNLQNTRWYSKPILVNYQFYPIDCFWFLSSYLQCQNYFYPYAFTLIFYDIYKTESNFYDNWRVKSNSVYWPIGLVTVVFMTTVTRPMGQDTEWMHGDDCTYTQVDEHIGFMYFIKVIIILIIMSSSSSSSRHNCAINTPLYK